MGPARSRDILFRRDQGASLAQVSKTRVARGRSGGRRRPERACVIPLPEATSNASPSAAESIADALLPAPRVAPDRELLTVTALDAGHCPGSVGFLFEGRVRSHLSHGRFQT